MSGPLDSPDFGSIEGLRLFWEEASHDPRFYYRHQREFLEAAKRHGITLGALARDDNARRQEAQAEASASASPAAPSESDVRSLTLETYKAQREKLTGIKDAPRRSKPE